MNSKDYGQTINDKQSRTSDTESKNENATFYSNQLRVSKNLDDSRKWFNNQKKILLSKKQIYKDPFFLTNDESLYYSEKSEKFDWMKPHEIKKNPQFIKDGQSRFDVVQGMLGDCWLLAAIGSLSLHPKLMNQVIPEDQYFDKSYVGAFLFRLWCDGIWYDVVVDDQLPTQNGQLVYMKSSNLDEFWSALLEKAFAKLKGSYKDLNGGLSWKAMETLTGGIVKIIELGPHASPMIWDIMINASNIESIMCCPISSTQFQLAQKQGLFIQNQTNPVKVQTNDSRKKCKMSFLCLSLRSKSTKIKKPNKAENGNLYSGSNNKHRQTSDKKNIQEFHLMDENVSQRETKIDKGLVEGHAYSVTNVKTVNSVKGSINLVRIRNPWGNEFEWKGAYSDYSSEWDEVDDSEKKRLKLSFSSDGEFWMCFEDFITYFSSVEICNVDDKDDGKIRKIYNKLGKWSQNISINSDSYHLNPQYRFIVLPNEKDPEKKCEIIICITISERSFVTNPDISIIYYIFKIEDPKYSNIKLDSEFFQTNSFYLKYELFSEGKICSRCKLSPGEYVIIPSTLKQEIEADFLLRILCGPELLLE